MFYLFSFLLLSLFHIFTYSLWRINIRIAVSFFSPYFCISPLGAFGSSETAWTPGSYGINCNSTCSYTLRCRLQRCDRPGVCTSLRWVSTSRTLAVHATVCHWRRQSTWCWNWSHQSRRHHLERHSSRGIYTGSVYYKTGRHSGTRLFRLAS